MKPSAKRPLAVLPDHAADEHHLAAGENAVGVALRPRPAGRVENRVGSIVAGASGHVRLLGFVARWSEAKSGFSVATIAPHCASLHAGYALRSPQDASLRDAPSAAMRRSSKRCSLPVCVRGKRAHILDGARILVGRDRRLDVFLQHLGQRLVAAIARTQHHVGLDDLAALVVGRADHAALGDRRMRQQGGLDLGTGDVVAGRNDHVVGARLVPEIAVGIHQIGVAGDVPAVLHVLALARVGEIAASGRSAHGQAADRAGRHLVAVVVDDARLVARHRPAGRAGADRVLGRADEDVQHLGRADAVEDLDAGCVQPGVEGRLRQAPRRRRRICAATRCRARRACRSMAR